MTKMMISNQFLARLCCIILMLCGAQHIGAQINTNRMMQIGRNALYFEDYVLSIQYFNRVIIVKPYLAEPYYYRGVAKYYLDDLTGCESDCDVALEINPFLIGAYNLRGIARLRQERPSAAKEDFEAGLKYEPDNINLLLNVGIANINLKEYDTAIAQYDKVLTYDKQNVPAILYRGIALVEKGDTLSAINEFKRATKINAYSPDAFTYLGMLCYQTSDFQGALENFNKLTELCPKDAIVYVNRAITRYNLDDMRGCSADLDEALRLDPKCKMAYQNRGMLRAEVGDLNRAADDFSHALALDPSDDIVLFNRAIIYGQLGENNNALQDLNIIIAKHPDFGPAYAQRAYAKRALGDNKGAELDYNTALNFEQERVKHGLANGQKSEEELEEERKNKEQNAENDKKKKKKSRSKNDNNMKNYDQMVVVADFGDNDDKLSQENKESIRGRVQDREIAIDLEPIFGLTFFAADTVLPNAPYFNKSVADFNARKLMDQKLVISNRELQSDDLSATVFSLITEVNNRLDADASNPQLYMLRGLLYSVVMNYNSAITDFSACLLKEPSNVNALFCRATARYRMVETIRDMEAETSAGNMDGDFMGSASVSKQVVFLDYDLIVQDLQKVLELEPNNEFALYNISLVLCQRKRFDEALQMLDRAIAVNPQFAEAYFNRGIIKLYKGDDDDANKDLSHAGELGMFKAYNVLKRFAN